MTMLQAMNECPRPPAFWLPEIDRRHLGRLEVRHLRTRLGRVMDIGPGGIRVRGHPWPKIDTYSPIEVELYGMPEVLPLRVMVAWTSRPTMLTREIGLVFVDLNEHARHALSGLFAVCKDIKHARAS